MTPPSGDPLTRRVPEATACAADLHQAFQAALCEWLAIPSVSADPSRTEAMHRAAGWLTRWLREGGLDAETITGHGPPAVAARWDGAGPDAPTLLVYGHYDVQPEGPLEAWTSPPFEPTVRGGNLYARGTSDDKGQILAMLAGAVSYLRAGLPLPLNLRVLCEGEEEMSSPNLRSLLTAEAERFSADGLVIADQPMIDRDTPLVLYGVRGGVYLEVIARGPASDLHSGTFGGAVVNPFDALVHLIAGLRDPDTRRIAVPGFYDRVRDPDADERQRLAQGPVTEEAVRALTGAPALGGEQGWSTAERMSLRPTLEIHGMPGGYTGPGKMSVIPAEARAKLSCRLVPDQDPEEIAALLSAHLHERCPAGVTLEVNVQGVNHPVVVDHRSPAVLAAQDAYRAVFGSDPVFLRGGGSLPVLHDVRTVLGPLPVALIGFGLPDDNTHGPDEKLHLPLFRRGIDTAIAYYHAYAERHRERG